MRRCSFQGDVLAGALAVFVAWTKAFLEEASGSSEAVLPEMNMMVLAGFGGCTVARTASACAFQVRGSVMHGCWFGGCTAALPLWRVGACLHLPLT